MAGRENVRLVPAFLLGVIIAFPLGMIVAGRGGDSPERRIADAPADASARQVFSPSLANDPHFLARQRESADLFEQQCRDSDEYCAEAAQLRRWLNEKAGR